MDNLKLSHVEKDVIESIAESLDKNFGKESPLTTSRGKVLEDLGLALDYTQKGKMKISMFEHVKKLIDGIPNDMQGYAKTPVANHLFVINPECEKLTEKDTQMFHHMVTKLLYLCK